MMNNNLFIQSYKKIEKYIPVFLLIISFFELLMMIYGFATFDFNDFKYICYIISYGVLLLSSLIVLLLIYKLKNKIETKTSLLKGICITYEVIIMIWSIVLSSFECVYGNYPIIFFTIIFVIPNILVITPYVNASITILGTTFIYVIYIVYGDVIYTSFFINTIVATIMNVLIIFKCYKASENEYKTTVLLSNLALKDSLTGLNNRRAFDDYLAEELNNNIVLIMLDIDNFKQINDSYGHKKGDECLAFVAKELSRKFGEANIYRFGGDEYAIISKNNQCVLYSLLNELINELKDNNEYSYLSFSAGIYKVKENISTRSAIQNADRALYTAKNNGKGKVVIFEDK